MTKTPSFISKKLVLRVMAVSVAISVANDCYNYFSHQSNLPKQKTAALREPQVVVPKIPKTAFEANAAGNSDPFYFRYLTPGDDEVVLPAVHVNEVPKPAIESKNAKSYSELSDRRAKAKIIGFKEIHSADGQQKWLLEVQEVTAKRANSVSSPHHA